MEPVWHVPVMRTHAWVPVMARARMDNKRRFMVV